MSGYIDLHCHWIPGVDDGAPTIAESLDMLRRLGELGFGLVVATPHMRPGLFDNTRETLLDAYASIQTHLQNRDPLPQVALSCEHYFDDIVFQRLMTQQALPYPGERAALLEFYESDFPPFLLHRFVDLRRQGLLPVIAHPERYQHIWRKPETLERLLDGGAAAVLDTAALVGHYGRRVKRCAEHLLERELYDAACSDAHRADDITDVAAAMRRIEKLYGADEVDFLFRTGPTALLSGKVPE